MNAIDVIGLGTELDESFMISNEIMASILIVKTLDGGEFKIEHGIAVRSEILWTMFDNAVDFEDDTIVLPIKSEDFSNAYWWMKAVNDGHDEFANYFLRVTAGAVLVKLLDVALKLAITDLDEIIRQIIKDRFQDTNSIFFNDVYLALVNHGTEQVIGYLIN